MKLIEWINGITKLNKSTMEEFQNNISEAIEEASESGGDGILTGSVIGYNGDTIPEGYEEVSYSGGSGDSTPIGTGMDYFGTVAPQNYMFADGSAISREQYSELFAIIGTTYGAGDGSTTFNLPDKREAVSIMKGSTYKTLGQSVGANTKAIAKANLPNVAIKVKYQHYPITYNSDASGTFSNNKRSIGIDTNDTTSSSSVATEALGDGTAFNVMQKTLVCNYIIKVK
jgi:microcystin-dependent protein